MFFSSGKTGVVFDESTGQFHHVDFEEAKRALKLTKQAAANGAKGIPELKDTKKDALAASIDEYIGYLVSLAKSKLLDRIRAAKSLSKFQSQGSVQDMTEKYESATKDLTKTAREFYNEIFLLKKDWILSEKHLKEFREKNNLNRHARYPEERVGTIGLIILFTIIEMCVTAYALGDAHPSGPLGVIIEILMFSFVNVGVSFCLGFVIWRYFFHVQKIKLCIAALAFPIMIFILFLNFFLAHYRDAISKMSTTVELTNLQTSIQQLGGQAIDTLITNPLAMDGVKSYLLLFVGLLVAIITTWKSFHLDDQYPGYGKLSREQRELAKKLNYKNKTALEDINDLVEDYSKQISSQRLLIKGNESAILGREEDFGDLYEKYNIWLEQTEIVGKALYAHYQEENIKAREKKQKPKCFDLHDYVLPKDAKIEVSFPKLPPIDPETVEKMEENYIGKLNKQAKNYLDKFTSLEQASPDKELNDEFKVETIFPAEER